MTTGVTGASITSVSGSGTTRNVTVNTGSGNGTIRLDVVDDDSIKDTANNPLGGVGIGNGTFTSGESYSINKPANINVLIGGANQGICMVPVQGSQRVAYALDAGPGKWRAQMRSR